MKKIIAAAFFVLVVLVVSGCTATYNKPAYNWVGYHICDPDRTVLPYPTPFPCVFEFEEE